MNNIAPLYMFIIFVILMVSYTKRKPESLVTTCILGLITVALYGGSIMKYGIIDTNITSVVYPFALLSVYIHHIYYRDTTTHMIMVSALAIVAFQVIRSLFGIVNMEIVVGSVLAYIISSATITHLYDFIKINSIVKYIIIISIAQIIDSIVFYTVAFYHHDTMKILLSGLVVKIIVGILIYPILLLKKNNDQHGR